MKLPKRLDDFLTLILKDRRPVSMIKLKHLADEFGLPRSPVGDANEKTGTPSTYRKVGDTCPSSCPYLSTTTCYAMYGHIPRLQDISKEKGVLGDLTAAAIAMTVAAQIGSAARLHVSGDFGKGNKPDKDYTKGLIEISSRVKARFEADYTSWTYTHFLPAQMKRWHDKLDEAGIRLLYSDHIMAGGTAVFDFDKIKALKTVFPEFGFVKCPAQLTHNQVTCAQCMLCPEAKERNIVVVFEPHGTGEKRLRSLPVFNGGNKP